MAHKTWDLGDLIEGKDVLPCKWVYKKKLTLDYPTPKYKACLIAKGFKQQKEIDFEEVFSQMVR